MKKVNPVTLAEIADAKPFELCTRAVKRIKDLGKSQQIDQALLLLGELIKASSDPQLLKKTKWLIEGECLLEPDLIQVSKYYLENYCDADERLAVLAVILNYRYLHCPQELLIEYFSMEAGKVSRTPEYSPLVLLFLLEYKDKLEIYLDAGYSSDVEIQPVEYIYPYDLNLKSGFFCPQSRWRGYSLRSALEQAYPDLLRSPNA